MFVKREIGAAFLIALLCFTLSVTSSAMTANTHLLSNAAETSAVGGNGCDDFFNGFAVGMGIGAVFGCVWCSA
jgi:hypothetical protein